MCSFTNYSQTAAMVGEKSHRYVGNYSCNFQQIFEGSDNFIQAWTAICNWPKKK